MPEKPEKFESVPSQDKLKQDWEEYQRKNAEYGDILDEIYTIKKSAKSREEVDKIIQEKYVPMAKQLYDERENLIKTFEQKYGERGKEFRDQEMIKELEKPMHPEDEEEWERRLMRHSRIEEKYGIAEIPEMPKELKEKISKMMDGEISKKKAESKDSPPS